MLSMQTAKIIEISSVSSLICDLCYYNTKDLLYLMIKMVEDVAKFPCYFFGGEPCMCATPIFHPNKKICMYVSKSR